VFLITGRVAGGGGSCDDPVPSCSSGTPSSVAAGGEGVVNSCTSTTGAAVGGSAKVGGEGYRNIKIVIL